MVSNPKPSPYKFPKLIMDYYKVTGKYGTQMIYGDWRLSPCDQISLKLEDVKDLVERGYFVYLKKPIKYISKINVDQYIKNRLAGLHY